MKVTLILFTVFWVISSCSSSKNTETGPEMKVFTATYTEWSDPPPSGSDIPERGTDLRIVVQNWPAGYAPEYVVYNNRRSSSVTFDPGVNGGNTVTIAARIIRMSGLLQERSGFTDSSDRLVYTTAEGESGYIEIDSWQREDD